LCSEALDLFKAQLKSRDACSVSNSEVRFPARPRDDVLENPCDLVIYIFVCLILK
jgi:hypothetical protein